MDSAADNQAATDSGKTRPLILLSQIGAGTFGKVYFALLDNTRGVAVKVMNRPDPDKTVQDPRVLQVARELEYANPDSVAVHRNLVEMLLPFHYSGWACVVMEYCNGGRLSDLLALHRARGMPMPRPDAYLILMQLARAVRHLHRNQLLHRDIKPDNVLFTTRKPQRLTIPPEVVSAASGAAGGSSLYAPPYLPAGNPTPVSEYRVKLTDYGLMRPCTATTGATLNLDAMTVGAGTRLWMAPEVFSRDGRYGLAADVFALGIVAIECLAGYPPIKVRGSAMEGVSPDVVARATAGLAPRFVSALTRAVGAVPAHRPTASEFLDALKEAASASHQMPLLTPTPAMALRRSL